MIGRALTKALEKQYCRVYPLLRNNNLGPHYYLQNSDFLHLDPSIPLHGIINLAGKNINDSRWTKKSKEEILDSRIKLTRKLSETIAQLPKLPEVYLSASAIGYYGTRKTETYSEESEAGADFLANLAERWEEATIPAQQAGIRTALLRFGLVLSADGGLIQNLILPYRLACVGPIGSGDQLMSWIAMHDALKIINTLIDNDKFEGAINVVSGTPISNRDFTFELAKAIGRFRLPRIPEAIVRIMFGELADAALLPSSAVSSTRMKELGVNLDYPEIKPALEAILH